MSKPTHRLAHLMRSNRLEVFTPKARRERPEPRWPAAWEAILAWLDGAPNGEPS